MDSPYFMTFFLFFCFSFSEITVLLRAGCVLLHATRLLTRAYGSCLQMVPGALLPTAGLRLPTTVGADGWSSTPLDSFTSLANYITGLRDTAAPPRNLPALTDPPEGECSSLYARLASLPDGLLLCSQQG